MVLAVFRTILALADERLIAYYAYMFTTLCCMLVLTAAAPGVGVRYGRHEMHADHCAEAHARDSPIGLDQLAQLPSLAPNGIR